MVYTLGDKTIKIPDAEIEKNMKLLELTKEEAIEMLSFLHSFQLTSSRLCKNSQIECTESRMFSNIACS